jgi:phosphotransferase family enzyme
VVGAPDGGNDLLVGLLDDVVERTLVGASDGKSGTPIERVVLRNGETFIVKRVAAGSDWLMRATGDTGRIERLWDSGLFTRLPEVVDPAIVAVEADADGWLVIMPDQTGNLLPESGIVSRAVSRRILHAAAAMHRALAGTSISGLCDLGARYTFLSPATTEREKDGSDLVPKMIGRGWGRFADVAPTEVWSAVAAIHADPAPFAAQIAKVESTVIHGDLKFGNVGVSGDRIVFIDWGDRTGIAPPMVEFAWYLAINGTRIGATRQEVIDDYHSGYPSDPDGGSLPLGLLGGLAQLGWNKALLATGDDEDVAAMERDDLEWWIARAREGLEQWSPE